MPHDEVVHAVRADAGNLRVTALIAAGAGMLFVTLFIGVVRLGSLLLLAGLAGVVATGACLRGTFTASRACPDAPTVVAGLIGAALIGVLSGWGMAELMTVA